MQRLSFSDDRFARPLTGNDPREVADLLQPALRLCPDQVCMVDLHGSWTYRSVEDLSVRAVQLLRAAGVGPGVRVAACLPNTAAIVVAFLAAMRLGAVWIGVNRALAVSEKTYLLRDAEAVVFLGDDDALTQVDHVSSQVPTLKALHRVDLTALEPVGLDPNATTPVDPHAPAVIAYTSGTTGRPKGVIHSQYNLSLLASVLARTQTTEGHVKGVCLPLTIPNVMVAGVLETFCARGSCICIDRIDAARVAASVEANRIERLHLPAAVIHDLVTRSEILPEQLASLTDLMVGGGPSTEELRKSYTAKFGRCFSGGYGLTEAPSAVARERVGDLHVKGSSGSVLPHLRVTILGPDGLGPDGLGPDGLGQDDLGLPVGAVGRSASGPAPMALGPGVTDPCSGTSGSRMRPPTSFAGASSTRATSGTSTRRAVCTWQSAKVI